MGGVGGGGDSEGRAGDGSCVCAGRAGGGRLQGTAGRRRCCLLSAGQQAERGPCCSACQRQCTTPQWQWEWQWHSRSATVAVATAAACKNVRGSGGSRHSMQPPAACCTVPGEPSACGSLTMQSPAFQPKPAAAGRTPPVDPAQAEAAQYGICIVRAPLAPTIAGGLVSMQRAAGGVGVPGAFSSGLSG